MAATPGRGQNPVGEVPGEEDVKSGIRQPSYSPYAGRRFPTEVYWGNTHVHTNNSLDTHYYGVTLPDNVAKNDQERVYTSPIWYTP